MRQQLSAHTIENGATRAQSHARTDDSASRARDPGDPVESLCEGLTQAFERACCHAQIQRSPARSHSYLHGFLKPRLRTGFVGTS